MIPRLGDGNNVSINVFPSLVFTAIVLENDSPSRGRKQYLLWCESSACHIRLENDSSPRGRKWKINRQSQQETVDFDINQYCIVLIN